MVCNYTYLLYLCYYRLRRKKENLIAEGIMSHTRTGATLPIGIADVSTAAPRLTPEALSQLPQQQQQIGTPTGHPPTGQAPTAAAAVAEKYETVIGGFLAVKVVRGGQLVRKKDDTKLHHSYEVSCGCTVYFMYCVMYIAYL